MDVEEGKKSSMRSMRSMRVRKRGNDSRWLSIDQSSSSRLGYEFTTILASPQLSPYSVPLYLRTKVRFRPGLPEKMRELLVIEAGHFDPVEVMNGSSTAFTRCFSHK